MFQFNKGKSKYTVIAGIALIPILLSNCSSTYPNRIPIGEAFPEVKGRSLNKEQIEIPGHFSGSKVILLLGYKQDSQFDIDRWLIGLDMTKVGISVYEIPTIQGLFPRMFQTTIDNGMRSGIPKELWGGVITIYKDGERVQNFTGNEAPNNARVILLSENGVIMYFHDRGFSVPALNSLREKIEGTPK
jgi:hypothetical protein